MSLISFYDKVTKEIAKTKHDMLSKYRKASISKVSSKKSEDKECIVVTSICEANVDVSKID